MTGFSLNKVNGILCTRMANNDGVGMGTQMLADPIQIPVEGPCLAKLRAETV
jgi:hypothetical protein